MKRERFRGSIYLYSDEARRDTSDYIGMLYNPKRRHSCSNGRSSVKTVFSAARLKNVGGSSEDAAEPSLPI